MKIMVIPAFMFAAMMCILACSGIDYDSDESSVMRILASPSDESELSRSVLDETAAFEDMVTEITAAAFDEAGGHLLATAYNDSGELEIMLPKGGKYEIFILANMGDQSGRIPADRRDMERFRYDVQSYSRMREKGLPMVCTVVTAWTKSLNLNLRRLMAKLVVAVDKSNIAQSGGGGADSFVGHKMEVSRVARAIYPFAPDGSSAKSPDDLFMEEDIEYEIFPDMDVSTGDGTVLYVPENMQGVKSGAYESVGGKSESNPELLGEELCTYVSLDGYKNGYEDGVYGKLTYRFFPGADNLSNFDLKGGMSYNLTLKLTWNGMYTEGDWRVERSDWVDRRKIQLSLHRDGGFETNLSFSLAKGSVHVPVYIYYTPQGEAYEPESEGGMAHHYDKGWNFAPMKPVGGQPAFPTDNEGEIIGEKMSIGFVEHQDYRTIHYVTVSPSAENGYSNFIRYFTCDGRREAGLEITVTEPVIDFSPSLMSFFFHECGYESRRTIKVEASSAVRPCNIMAYTDETELITLGDFNRESGTVDVWWNDANMGTSPREAKVFLHSEACGATANCTLIQQNRPGLSVGESEYGGGAEIEY